MAVGVFVGLSTIDAIYSVDEFPAANSKVVAKRQELLAGGPATNAAITFSHLGGDATLAAAVGRNPVSAIIREEVARYSVTLVDLAPEYEGLPAISSVWVDRRGRRSVVSVNASNLSGVSTDVELATLRDARILQVDGHSMDACLSWADAAHAAGIPVVMDGGSWKHGTEELLKCVDMAICSEDFIPPGCRSQEETIRCMQERNVMHIAITHGAGAIYFVSGSDRGTIPVPQVDVVDTNGAGDILHGAFCYFASSGCGFVEALREAAGIASEACRHEGTRRWMQADPNPEPGRDEAESREPAPSRSKRGA